jgi:menaquinone-dependent protoporphyrinogen oxidase
VGQGDEGNGFAAFNPTCETERKGERTRMDTDTENQHGMNRRDFFWVSCGATLALILRRGIAGASDAQASQKVGEPTCQRDGKMTKGVLVAYATRCGSTGSVAEAMAEALRGMGIPVEVRLVENVKDLGPYQAVIVGSAIRRGQWLPEATAFVKNNQDALSRLPTAYFVVCLTMRDDTPENRDKVLAYLDPVRKKAPRITPAAVGLFPGSVDFSKLSLVHKSILEAKGVSEGDYRDLPAVKGWASDVGPALVAAQPLG